MSRQFQSDTILKMDPSYISNRYQIYILIWPEIFYYLIYMRRYSKEAPLWLVENRNWPVGQNFIGRLRWQRNFYLVCKGQGWIRRTSKNSDLKFLHLLRISGGLKRSQELYYCTTFLNRFYLYQLGLNGDYSILYFY